MAYKPVGADENGNFPPRVQTALDATYADKAIEPRTSGKKAVAQDELVYNVLDHGVIGDGVTDDVSAIEALATMVAGNGGGRLYFPRRTYAVSRSIRCASNIEYAGDKAIIKNTYAGSAPIHMAAFVPGYIHGAGFYAANGAGKVFPRVTINDVTVGSTTITASTAGAFAGVTAGTFVAVRSSSNYVSSAVEVPSQLYFAKVLSVSGDTLSLSEASPYAITGALAHPLTGNPLDGQAAVMAMVENVVITGFDIDALFPVWGGGCYGFELSNIRPYNRERFSSLVTLNSVCRFEIKNCEGDWYYTFCELALGSADGRVHRNRGTYRTGGSIFHPVSIVESSHNITVEDNTLTVPATFNDATKVMFNIAHSQDVRVRNNIITVSGTMDAVAGIGAAVVAERNVTGVRFDENKITVGNGVNRVFSIGANAGSTIGPKNFTVRNNFVSGALNPAVNEWIVLLLGDDFIVDGNRVPSGVSQRVGPATRGRFNGGEQDNGLPGNHVTVSAMAANILPATTVKTIGRVPWRGVVSCVRVEVSTAFNAPTSSTLTVGFSGTPSGYATSVNLAVAGVTYIYPGHANAGTALGKRLTAADRDVQATFTAAGGSATAGAALVTVYYEPNMPPAS